MSDIFVRWASDLTDVQLIKHLNNFSRDLHRRGRSRHIDEAASALLAEAARRLGDRP